MRWIIVALVVGLGGGCSDSGLEKRVTELEARITKLEQQPSPGAAVQAPPTASAPDEQAAGALLRDASIAMKNGDFDTAKAKVAELTQKYPSSRAARAAERVKAEIDVVGRDEVPLEVDKWFQGGPGDVKGGKAQLLVFWEVWCPHCRREVPELADTYTKFHPKGLQVVGLTRMTRDITDQQVNDFIKENELPFPIAKEKDDSLSKAYGVEGIPAAAIVKNGKVVWRGSPGGLTDAMLEKFLGS